MSRPAWLLQGLLASLLFGCVPQYRPPTENAPHAVLKLRRTYEVVPGPRLRERVLVDEHVALQSSDSSELARTPKTDAILVHPTPATFSVEAAFFHEESRLVHETYYVHEPVQTTESYNCGTGSRYQSCTRSVTRYNSVQRQRLVTRVVEVSDGSCRRALSFAPATGQVYLLQFTYQDSGACALSCYEQRADEDGALSQTACGAAATD